MNNAALANALPHNKYAVITEVSVRLHVGVFVLLDNISCAFLFILKVNVTLMSLFSTYPLLL